MNLSAGKHSTNGLSTGEPLDQFRMPSRSFRSPTGHGGPEFRPSPNVANGLEHVVGF